jgi:hypothetical protein
VTGFTGRPLVVLAPRFLASCLGAVAVAALLTTTSTAGRQAPSTVYSDAIGDAGDAPDVARVTFRPVAGGLAVDVTLAEPTRLGPYGWILLGVDTDRNAYTGGGRGDELLLFVNGEGATFTHWIGGGFSSDFAHHDVEAAFSGTDLTLVLSWADIGARSFNFSVATLREHADLAPGFGIATYPRTRTGRRHAHRVRRAPRGSTLSMRLRGSCRPLPRPRRASRVSQSLAAAGSDLPRTTLHPFAGNR